MKYMKWEDLKPGDILKFNLEFVKAFKIEFGRLPAFKMNGKDFYDFNQDKNFIVTQIIEHPHKIFLYLNGMCGRFEILKTGTLWSLLMGPPVFEIVALIGE